MSRGPGLLQRWLMEEALEQEAQTIRQLAHRWARHKRGEDASDRLENGLRPYLTFSRSDEMAVRRALEGLLEHDAAVRREGRLYGVEWGTEYERDEIVVHGPPYFYLDLVAYDGVRERPDPHWTFPRRRRRSPASGTPDDS